MTEGLRKAGRGAKTTWQQRLAMLEWLEEPTGSNFKLITGSASEGLKCVVAGMALKKTDGYRLLAESVNQKCGTYDWEQKNGEDRYSALLMKYKNTKRELESADGAKYCLTDLEIAKGVTIEMKINDDCPDFNRLDKLFGGRQNIIPSFVRDPLSVSVARKRVATPEVLDEFESHDNTSDSEEETEMSGSVVTTPPQSALLRQQTTSIATPNIFGATTVIALTKKPRRALTPAATQVGDQMRMLCEETVKGASPQDLTKKLAEGKNSKKDFSSVFVESRNKEQELAEAKFEFEKNNYADELQIKERAIAEQTKTSIICELIKMDKSPADIAEYIKKFNL